MTPPHPRQAVSPFWVHGFSDGARGRGGRRMQVRSIQRGDDAGGRIRVDHLPLCLCLGCEKKHRAGLQTSYFLRSSFFNLWSFKNKQAQLKRAWHTKKILFLLRVCALVVCLITNLHWYLMICTTGVCNKLDPGCLALLARWGCGGRVRNRRALSSLQTASYIQEYIMKSQTT